MEMVCSPQASKNKNSEQAKGFTRQDTGGGRWPDHLLTILFSVTIQAQRLNPESCRKCRVRGNLTTNVIPILRAHKCKGSIKISNWVKAKINLLSSTNMKQTLSTDYDDKRPIVEEPSVVKWHATIPSINY